MNTIHDSNRRPIDPRRCGFTLVELMVTMAIMVILSAMLAVALGGAEESAQVAHTRAVIARLHTLLMDRYESYRWRRLPIQIAPGSSPAQANKSRCDAVRELMRMELPESFADITNPPVTSVPRTATSASYLSALGTAPSNTTYQGADCLYMIVTMGLEENDVLENFSQSDIGHDPNNPSIPCFIDSWNNPIQFIRWAPGFNSPLQPNSPTDRDQTDPTGVYGSPPTTFALYPLIYSAGPDGYYDLQPPTATDAATSNNPFGSMTVGAPTIINPPNTTGTLGSYDNVTNQMIGAH